MANEQRLVDAVRYREVLERYANAPHVNILYSTHSKVMRMAIDTCIEFLDMQKAVDAVEVVRCKDCKHWHEETGWCDNHSWFIEEDGEPCHPWESNNWKMFDADYFCKDGERKDNGQLY